MATLKSQESVVNRSRTILITTGFLFGLSVWSRSEGVTSSFATVQGFGAKTKGGIGQPVVHVTNLGDSGPGSLRDAVSKGNRTIVFDIAGEIIVSSKYIQVTGAYLTIDGASAPAPGITIKNGGLEISGKRGAHDVMVRGVRIRNAPRDGIQIADGAYNVVVDQVSIHGSGDGNLDISHGSRDVTVSWNIFAEPVSRKTMLIKNNPSRITLHHNIFVKGQTRNPQVSIDQASNPATDVTLDMWNNLVFDWGAGYGTLVRSSARASIVNNFYSSNGGDKEDALIVCGGADINPKHARECSGETRNRARAYVRGNFSADDLTRDINAAGNEARPFPKSFAPTQDACTAAHDALANAGVRPLDSMDRHLLSLITLPSCPKAERQAQ
jgi:hypothetical protein